MTFRVCTTEMLSVSVGRRMGKSSVDTDGRSDTHFSCSS